LGVEIDRKTLSQIASSDKEYFKKICEEIKRNLATQ
jgi:ribosomal protein L20